MYTRVVWWTGERSTPLTRSTTHTRPKVLGTLEQGDLRTIHRGRPRTRVFREGGDRSQPSRKTCPVPVGPTVIGVSDSRVPFPLTPFRADVRVSRSSTSNYDGYKEVGKRVLLPRKGVKDVQKNRSAVTPETQRELEGVVEPSVRREGNEERVPRNRSRTETGPGTDDPLRTDGKLKKTKGSRGHFHVS